MDDMDIRLIAMDLDGTALQRDRCSFSPRLHRALNAAHAKGSAIVIVTGRQFGLLPPVLQQTYEWSDYAILCNGGQIRKLNTGELRYSLRIDPCALAQLLDLAREFDLPLEFSVDSKLYLTQESYDKQLPWPDLTFHRDAILANHGHIVPSLVPFCDKNIEKVNLLCISPEIRDAVADRLSSISVSAVWSSSTCMEITHPDATKGQTLKILCDRLQIPMEAVMALGDSGNDITMLRQAGLGVAMGNAPDFVKRAADACTDSNEADGAAKAIEQYAL
jgi:Cof subfamily protein (haloacid dehalogenase superfamily)